LAAHYSNAAIFFAETFTTSNPTPREDLRVTSTRIKKKPR